MGGRWRRGWDRWGSDGSGAVAEPGAGEVPVIADPFRADFEEFGNLFGGVAEEVAEFEDVGGALVYAGEGVQGVVERNDFFGVDGVGEDGGFESGFVEGRGSGASSALGGLAAASGVDQDVAHGALGDADEVVAIGDGVFAAGQLAGVGFVDEFGGGPLAAGFAAEQVPGRRAQGTVEFGENGFF